MRLINMRISPNLRRALGRVPGVKTAVRSAEGLASVRAVLMAGWFDLEWYEAQTGRAFGSMFQAATHYVALGRRAGLSPHVLFEPSWVEPDQWRTSRTDPLARFVGRAHRSDVSTHPLFDPVEWVRRHPEATAHPQGAFGHLVGTLEDDTELTPVQALRDAGAEKVRWGDARRQALATVREWREQESRANAERVSTHHDAKAADAFVRRWAGAPLPAVDGPVVSIITPVYNRATTLIAAIASVQAQTLQNWELIVVDDGSTDGTPEVVEELARQDPRIRLVRGQRAGVSRTRNIGAEHASGRYLAWLDSDNTWTPDFLSTAVAAMHGRGLRAAYAQSQLVASTGTRYRALDAGKEHLEVRNHVDLNVLVAERELVDQVGGFDVGLRRTVDYDLVWKLAQVVDVTYLPYIGVVYDDDELDENRITTMELFSWKEVVRSKHLVDWEAAAAEEPRTGLTSVVVAARSDWSGAWGTVLGALADAEDGTLEVVVTDDASSRATGAVLSALALCLPAVERVRLAARGLNALSWNVGLARTRGDVVVFLDETVTPSRGWLASLRAALTDSGAAAVQPLVVSSDGLVDSAGGFWCPSGDMPLRMLQGYPVEDAARLGRLQDGRLDMDLVDGPVVAVRRRDVVALRGFNCLYTGGWEVADLSMRLAEAGRGGAAACLRSTVDVVPPDDTTKNRGREVADREVFRSRWNGRHGTGGPWGALGFDVVRWGSEEPSWLNGVVRRPAPVLVRRVRATTDGFPSLRWAIKTATPPGPEAQRWGDLHFARSLADALERLGQQACIDYRTTLRRPSRQVDDVSLVLRGLLPVPCDVGTTNVLWVISHPELVTDDELRSYDAVFAASNTWAETAGKRSGRTVHPLLQATDPERFRPDAAEPDTGDDVLFVGNSRNIYRPVVRHLVETGHEVSVYGGRWGQFLPAGYLKGEHVANTRLASLYRSAGVVLNDHWDDMRDQGFVSNRLFDATAAGARVASDDVAGAEDLFGGLVQTFRDPAELRALVDGYREAFPDGEDRVALANRVRAEHSFDARARALLEEAVRLRT